MGLFPKPLLERWKTFKVFFRTWWWALGIAWFVVSTIDTLKGEVVPNRYANVPRVIDILPGWPWWAWALIGMGLLWLLTFESAHRRIRSLARQLDEKQRQLVGTREAPIVPKPVLTIHVSGEPDFGTSLTEGFPKSFDSTVLWCRIAATIEISQRMVVNSLELALAAEPIPVYMENPSDKNFWTAYYHYFQIPDRVNPGKYQAQLKVNGDGQWWASHDFWVTVPRK